MARARNIKPSIFKNELLGEADPLLTILFQGLWCLADREGRLEDRPKRIKAEIFPYREFQDFNGYLTVLQQLGFIDRYLHDGAAIIQVVNFLKHQSPHKTEKPSELPERSEKSTSCPLTVKHPLKTGCQHVKESLIPDSFNLIPDTGFIDSPQADADESACDVSSAKSQEVDEVAEAFEIFWTAGMVKVAKKKVLPLFASIVKREKFQPEQFAKALALDVRARLAAGQLGFDALHPTTYLNQERWKDEIRLGQTSANRKFNALDNNHHQGCTPNDTFTGKTIDGYATVVESA